MRIDWRPLTLELATLTAGVLLLGRLLFVAMPITVTRWSMSTDVATALMQNWGFDWQFMRDQALVLSGATIGRRMLTVLGLFAVVNLWMAHGQLMGAQA